MMGLWPVSSAWIGPGTLLALSWFAMLCVTHTRRVNVGQGEVKNAAPAALPNGNINGFINGAYMEKMEFYERFNAFQST